MSLSRYVNFQMPSQPRCFLFRVASAPSLRPRCSYLPRALACSGFTRRSIFRTVKTRSLRADGACAVGGGRSTHLQRTSPSSSVSTVFTCETCGS
jgi:hypothetical protein